MPYIKQGKRAALDRIVSEMWAAEIKADGDLNYLLFAYCKRCVTPSYNNYKNFIGELNECVAEIRRKLLADYEEKKLIENGEV